MTTIAIVPVTTEATTDTVVPAEPTTEQDEAMSVEPVVEDPVEEPPEAKRKPGRPTGSKSKIPGKPRAPHQKRVVVVDVPEEPEEIQEEIQEETPVVERALPGSRPIPTHGFDDRTVAMLTMLQQQANDRKNRKAALYKSWFS